METRSHKILPAVPPPPRRQSDNQQSRQLDARQPTTTHPPEANIPAPASASASATKEEASSDSTYGSVNGSRHYDPDTPVPKKRRPRSSQSLELQAQSLKLARRLDNNGARKPFPGAVRTEEAYPVTLGNRAFPCPLAIYGCTSTFGSKNEWKRHVNTQHMRLGFWRCDQCPTDGNRGPNDFNRKDLFIQHIRRMHAGSFRRSSVTKPGKDDAEEQALQDIAARCYRHIRSPPEQSACLFCDHVFHGIGSWDDRMEHVGRHMEVAKREGANIAGPQDWKPDESTHTWMANELIIAPHGDQWVLQDLDAQAWPGNPPPTREGNSNVPTPSSARPPVRQSIPGKRTTNHQYVPLRDANHIPHPSPGEPQAIAPSPTTQVTHHTPIQPQPQPQPQQQPQPHPQLQPQLLPQPQPQPRDAESHNIGLVSGPNGMLPYMQEPEDERSIRQYERPPPESMNPPRRPLLDCEWQDCNRRGVHGFASGEEMAEHLRDAHRTGHPETRQSTPQDFHTPPQLQPHASKRPMTQEGPYRMQEAERPRPPEHPWGYAMPVERPTEAHMVPNGYPQDNMLRRHSVPEHVRIMPATNGHHAPSFSQSSMAGPDRSRDFVPMQDVRPDVIVYERKDPDRRHDPYRRPERAPEPERHSEHDYDEDDEDQEYDEEDQDQDQDQEQRPAPAQERPEIKVLPRWRDEYGFKYSSTQDLTEDDILLLRERAQDLEMVLSNVWQAFLRTGSPETSQWGPLTMLVRRFAPNVLATAAQPGGFPPYYHAGNAPPPARYHQ